MTRASTVDPIASATVQSPQSEHQRTTRSALRGRKHVDYDMKYHPVDEVMRPKAAAARKARVKGRRLRSESSDSVTKLQPESSLMPQESASPNIHKAKAAHLSPPRKIARRNSSDSSNRRVTRAKVHGKKLVNYNMKYHPMDDVTRPAAARRSSAAYEANRARLTSQVQQPVVTGQLASKEPAIGEVNEDFNPSGENADGSTTEDEDEGSYNVATYNDYEAYHRQYYRQTFGKFDSPTQQKELDELAARCLREQLAAESPEEDEDEEDSIADQDRLTHDKQQSTDAAYIDPAQLDRTQAWLVAHTIPASEPRPTPRTPKANKKTNKASMATFHSFKVHEDLPGSTPTIKRQVAKHPISPGTDFQKENLGERSNANSQASA